MKYKKNELAYLAGYLDGDGCFYIGLQRRYNKKPKPIACIIISSVNKCTLTKFKNIFGGSVCTTQEAHNNSKTLYNYTIRKRTIKSFCNQLLEFLVEKKEECKLIIDFMNSKNIDFQEECLNKMKILKDTSNLVSKYHKKEFEKSRNTIIPNEADFSYLAGFIDAECSLNIQKYKPKDKPNYVYKILLQCNNTKSPVFKWILDRFGGVVHFINRLKHQKARKNQLTWRLSGKSLYPILNNIYTFLKYKKPVCEQLIKFYNTTLSNGGARHTDQFRSHYEDVLKIREDIVAKVHQLNSKGIKSP